MYLSIGPEAKKDIYNTFDPDKPISICLDPPSTERQPLLEMKQEGKTLIYTTDFYFTNNLPSNIVALSLSKNNTTPTGDQAAAADPTLFDTDSLQSGEICLHSWLLYTSQAPILDLTGKTLSLRKTLKQHFTPLIYAQKKTKKRSLMAEKKQEQPTNQSKFLTDSDIEVNPRFKTSVEEREYNTIPGSATAT